jgi:hypothetical protein
MQQFESKPGQDVALKHQYSIHREYPRNPLPIHIPTPYLARCISNGGGPKGLVEIYFLPDFLMPWAPVLSGPLPPALAAKSFLAFSSVFWCKQVDGREWAC